MSDLKKAVFRIQDEYDHDYKSDISRIVRIFKDKGYELSHSDAKAAWKSFSDSMAAGWLLLDEDDTKVFNNTRYYLNLEDD